MTKRPHSPEGSWTEEHPELGTGPMSFRDVYDPEYYELERDAVFGRAWLAIGRVEEVPRRGAYFTKELAVARTSLIVVRGDDEQIRAFHNVCRHRGNKLVWDRSPKEETSGVCRQFACKYHAWRYGLDGALKYVQQEDTFFDVDKDATGLVEVHCDVWAGFVFVNLDAEPSQTLREFLGPMLGEVEEYPFGAMTERYDFVADNESNWKLFSDAFQEYYHVPVLHSQFLPIAVRNPRAGLDIPHFQIDGPHRVLSSAGGNAEALPPEYLYPIDRVTRSGANGPWDSPVGELPPGVNPGKVEPFGLSSFQIFPNTQILIASSYYLWYRYWPTSATTHRYEASMCFFPARSVRERIAHEAVAVNQKELVLQDAGMLSGTQMGIESGAVKQFHLSDQEVLLRHMHKVVADWVSDYQQAGNGGVR